MTTSLRSWASLIGSPVSSSRASINMVSRSCWPFAVRRLASTILATISAGVPFGAATPYHCRESKPGTKSFMVGTFGKTSTRVVVVTASARNLSALMYSIAEGTVANTIAVVVPLRNSS